ncbi:hypothetical protein [Capnocytophaga bilenii]
MGATIIQATVNNVDLPTIQHLFKRLNIKTTILKEEKEDFLMPEESYFAMIDEARAQKGMSVTIDELKKRYLK